MITVFVPDCLNRKNKDGYLIGQRSEECIFITDISANKSPFEVGSFSTLYDKWLEGIVIYNHPKCIFHIYSQAALPKQFDVTQFVTKFNQQSTHVESHYAVAEQSVILGQVDFSKAAVFQAVLYRRNVIKFIFDKEADALARINQTVLLVVDMAIGLVIWFICFQSAWNVCRLDYQLIIGNTAKRLGDGLLWMSHNPGGLKLNPQLARFLSQFCNHHVRIWESYAVMLCNNCETILTTVGLFASPFGVSFLFGLVGDLLSVLTLHFYCFYIYAVRLYHFWITCLKSLWKLFFGQKINPLFDNRVDSIFSEHTLDHSNRRLILGSLIFAIFVWLLPTIIVYYVVFASIRLISLFSQMVLLRLMKVFIHSKPVILIAYLLNPYRFGVSIVTPSNNNNTRFHPLSVKEALIKYYVKEAPSPVLYKILQGDLI